MSVRNLLSVLVLALVALPAWAVLPCSTKAELEKAATVIACGDVTRVYEVQERSDHATLTQFVAEVLITSVEKGEGVEKGKTIFVRGTSVALDRDCVGGCGDWCQPKGTKARLYLVKDVGGMFKPAVWDGFQRADYKPYK